MNLVDLHGRDDGGLLEQLYRNVLEPSFSPEELDSLDALAVGLADGRDPRRFATVALDHAGDVVAGVVTELYSPEGVLLLAYLAVRPDVRGRGIGSFLLQQALPRWHAQSDALLTVGEVHDPRYWTDTDDEHPTARLRVFDRVGARVLGIPFIQPAIDREQARVRGFLLIALEVDPSVVIERDGAASLPTPLIAGFVRHYFKTAEGTRSVEDRELAELLAHIETQPEIPLLPLDQYERVPRLDQS